MLKRKTKIKANADRRRARAKLKECLITQENKKEIIYNLINSGLAGLLVLLGSLTSGQITKEGIFFAIIASLIVVTSKFKEYWDGEKGEYTTKLFSFVK